MRPLVSCASFLDDERTEFFFLIVTASGGKPSLQWLSHPPADLRSIGPMGERELRDRLAGLGWPEPDVSDEIARARRFKTTASASFFDRASGFWRRPAP